MSQHDYNIANQSGAAFRADLNLLLAAILSHNSGVTAPTVTTPYMLWADTGNDLMMMRNAANNGWLKLFTLSTNASPGVRQQQATYFTTSGSSAAYTLTPYPTASANVAGARYRVTFHTPPTGTPTLAVSGLSPVALKYKDLNGLKQVPTSVEIPSGWCADVEFDGTDFVVLDITRPQPMTPAEILSRLLTVDGSGSGLDADTIDGEHKTTFMSWYWYWTAALASNTTYTINLPAVASNGLLMVEPYMECVVADGGYAVGDHVPFSELVDDSSRPTFDWKRSSNQAVFKTTLGGSPSFQSNINSPGSHYTIGGLNRWRFKVVVISSIP